MTQPVSSLSPLSPTQRAQLIAALRAAAARRASAAVAPQRASRPAPTDLAHKDGMLAPLQGLASSDPQPAAQPIAAASRGALGVHPSLSSAALAS